MSALGIVALLAAAILHHSAPPAMVPHLHAYGGGRVRTAEVIAPERMTGSCPASESEPCSSASNPI